MVRYFGRVSIAPSTRGSAADDSVDIAEGTPSLRQVCETTGIYVYKSMYIQLPPTIGLQYASYTMLYG